MAENEKCRNLDGIWGWNRHGKLAVLDISESGRQIGEKLFVLLDSEQRKELAQFIQEQEKIQIPATDTIIFPSELKDGDGVGQSLTEITAGRLFLCLESRSVSVNGQMVNLTAKEFDILALLIIHPKRVFTYEMIMDLVWHEDYTFYSRKAVNNHVSNLRKKLKIAPDVHDYIKSVYGVGYKFEV